MKKDTNNSVNKFFSTRNKTKKEKRKLTQRDIKKYSNTKIEHVIDKIKEQELKYMTISVSIIIIIILSVCFIIFSAIQDTTSEYIIKTGDLEVLYIKRQDNMSDVINFVNAQAQTDRKGLQSEAYSFKITNTSKKEKKYEISIIDDADMIELDRCKGKLIDRKHIKYSLDGESMHNLNEQSNVIFDSTIAAGESQYYAIRIWISKDYKKSLTSHYHGKLSVKEKESE